MRHCLATVYVKNDEKEEGVDTIQFFFNVPSHWTEEAIEDTEGEYSAMLRIARDKVIQRCLRKGIVYDNEVLDWNFEILGKEY